MVELNGTYYFKTEEQLKATGWKWDHTSDCYRRDDKDDTVEESMITNLCGKQVTVVNGTDVHFGWNVTKQMVICHEWTVDRILTKYSNDL